MTHLVSPFFSYKHKCPLTGAPHDCHHLWWYLVLPSFRFGMGNCRVKYIAIPTTNCRGTLLHPTTKLMVHKESVTHPTIVATGASNQHLRAQTTRRTNSVCATSHVRTCVLKDAQILISTRIIPCSQTCTHTCMRMPMQMYTCKCAYIYTCACACANKRDTNSRTMHLPYLPTHTHRHIPH